MNKIISVVGPTSSGKTSFALRLARQALELKNKAGEALYIGVDLISVDSRQVYKGLEILSGADIPDFFSLVSSQEYQAKKNSYQQNTPTYTHFKHKSLPITLHGVSIIELNKDWSVAHFKNFSTNLINLAFKNKRLVILVGGTGLYHQHLFSTDVNLFVPPNEELREKAKNLSLEELQNWLKKIDLKRFEKMNNSDSNNPRRLLRAIEILLGSPESEKVMTLDKEFELEVFGLSLNLERLEEKIVKRVSDRLESGVLEEVQKLQKICSRQDLPVCSTLGVSDIIDYLLKKISKEECIKNWSLHEFQYAKRQITWFKKETNIIWLDDTQKKQYTLK